MFIIIVILILCANIIEYKQPEEPNKATDVDTMQHEFDELKAEYALLQQQQEKVCRILIPGKISHV